MLIRGKTGVILSGFVPRDAEMRYTSTGKSVCNFSVKTGDIVSEDGERTAQWMNCVAWQDVADAAQDIQKGDRVLCCGEIKQRSYTARDGEERTVTEVVCDFVQVMVPTISKVPELNGPKEPSNVAPPLPGAFEEVVTDDDLPF